MALLEKLQQLFQDVEARKNPETVTVTVKEKTPQQSWQQQQAAQQTAAPAATDNRTTAQKVADAQTAYDSYLANQPQVSKEDTSRKMLQDAINRIFAAPTTPIGEDIALPKTDTKERELKAQLDYYKGQQQKEENQKALETKLTEYESWSDADKAALDQYIMERDQEQNNWFMVDTSPSYNAVTAKLVQDKGLGEVRKMAEAVTRSRNAKIAEETDAAAQKVAQEHPFIGSGLAVGANVLNAYGGSVGAIKQYANRTGQFSTLDPNDVNSIAGRFGKGITQNVSQQLAGDGSVAGQLASAVYGGLMSGIDNVARYTAAGFNPVVAKFLAASGGFSNSLQEYSEMGVDPGRATVAALLNAAIEYATEEIPMDELVKIGKSKTVAKDLLKQFVLVEPTTEDINYVATKLMEAAVLQDKSANNQQIGELVDGGMSYEEAKQAVKKQNRRELLSTHLQAMFGGLFGGMFFAAPNPNVQNQVKEFFAQGQNEAQQGMTRQQAVDEQAAKILAQMPKEEPVQKTPGQIMAQNAVNEALGVESAKPATEVQPQAEARTEARTEAKPETSTVEATPVQNITTEQTKATQEPGIKGTGAAEANFSGKAEYQDLLTDDNVQRSRPDDVRNVEVPKVDSYGRNVSEFVGNAVGAEITPDKMVNTIEELVQEGALGFDRRRNQDALNDAAKEIEQKGANNIRRQITNAVANGKIRDGDIEKAMLLYSSYANKNGQQAMDIASELFVDLETMAHMTGRNLQLFKLIRKLTPEGQAMAIKKTVERSVENMIRSGQVKKDHVVEIDPELMKQYKDAAAEHARAVTDEQKEASAEKMQQAQQAIMASEAAKMPSTMKAKWDAWRYMSMLGNVKTQVRNIGGNVAMMPYKDVKDKMSAIFEKALPKEQRTKSFFNDPMLMEWAAADAKSTDVQNALKYSGKLGDDVTSAQFAENRRVFDNDALEAVRKFVEKVPQAGDMIFKNRYYEKSLAGFLKARGYNYDAVVNGQVSDAVMAEARGYAIQEAMKATFNDSNTFSDAIASIGRKNTDNPWSKALNVAAEGILPFRRTPANIVVRFTEYSPVGLAKGVWDMATKVKNGNLSAAAAIDQISAGMTGTMAMTLGYFLANGIAGVKLTGSGTEEDEKRQGHQDYALEFSINGQEYSYKIDWAAPANLPLFVGANIQKMIESKGGDTDVSWFMSLVRGMSTAFEPMLALSCLSSLNDLVEGARYAPEGEVLYSIAADVATSYFTQGIPALARQTYQASQKNKQTTFANSSDPTIRDLQKVGANIPFVGGAFQTDKVNEWGETETTESGIVRAFNAFINPGTFKTIDNGQLETEISRINGAGFDVSPPTVAKTASYTDASGTKHTDVRLTEEQYQAMAKTQGQTAAKLLDEMITRSDYKKLTDAQKADAISAVYEYAKEQGRKAAFGNDYHSSADAWVRSANGNNVQFFIEWGAKSTADKAVADVAASLKNGWKVTDAAKKDLDEAYTSYKNMSVSAKQKIMDEASSATKKYFEIRSEGVSLDDYLDALKNLKKVDGNNDAQVREAIASAANSPEVTDKIMMAYMTDYDPNDEKPNKTELRYQYARQKLGMSAQDYAKAYKAYCNGSLKKEKINSLIEAGFSKKDANTMYDLFQGRTDVVTWYNSKNK